MSTSSRRPAGRARHLLAPLVVVVLLAAAGALLHRTFRHLSWAELSGDLLALGPGVLLAALAATAISYLAMTGYDALALRYVGHPLPYHRYGLASFVATAFGNNLGASAVVGAALRARVYSRWEVPASAITRIIGFNLVTLALGAAVLAGGGMVHDPVAAAEALHLPAAAVLVAGSLMLASVVGYLVQAGTGRAVRWRGRRVDRPSRRLAVAQVVLSTFEWLTMAAALHVLLPAEGRMPFLAFAVAFSIATLAGLVSSVPGGLGVFETSLVVLIGSTTSPAGLAVALVAYRICYFALPLLLAAVLLLAHEARPVAAAPGAAGTAAAAPATPCAPVLAPSTSSARTWSARASSVLTPSVLALGVAAAGVFMVVVGDLPGRRELDLSAVTISLAGLAALLTARGLHRRLKAAWAATLVLLAGVTAVAAAHGDLALSAVTAALALLLVPARSAFHRGALLARPRNPLWPATAALLVGTSVWWHEFSGLGCAVDAPLWVASFSGDTPGADRLVMAAGAVGVLIGGRRTFWPAPPGPGAPDDDEVARVADVVARWGRCTSHLAFTGDKRFRFSPHGTAFLMYQVQGRSWVVMGDPVGNPADFPGLVRDFLAEVDRHGGRPVFYNVLDDHADLYRESGLSLAKLGEEAVVPLADFTLSGRARTNLRNCRNKSQRLGLTVEVVAPEGVAPLLPALREVSDAWLTHRNGKEKRFSLGAFDEEYVRRFPLVVVRREERIIAFATLWIGGDGREVQVDLMRRMPDGPRTVMTFLFVECISWAKENGFTSFNLGMAPLSGLRTDATAPSWDRLGHLLWTRGERFYNFRGLRTFKQGFEPRWRTCYVAAPGGLALPSAMRDVVTLVGGGIRGVVRG
ncbi:bifunctional lysylphosphatidylglycerol flippase/synthetase MprF [Paenibacillus sp. TRM 82003]|uniref:bifunctional lysylphosphatidylglycerol flippase/synthetase MprF n=1 Tax=Kineococcus sp. TRM81007 TaxID=2925831 RepID=UPI001F56507D|nr:bifunctional lysylphosphatidylglycerol flippase/synthetase MprF [Kineococcus sp. TRM81007]MCI2238228.1 bifunctional lysylphosphatidylglycerol flippase/synthetase MprF [Kineococcus sp. TRM81007]MCI3924100.1 bifunctional lysylphosphatidylglycerol flippase/synthetase MprF [Paenibacillus sp. TRM 82003]